MRFSRYQLLQQINNSGRGELWLAEQLGADGFARKVVVARLTDAANDNPAAVEAFINTTKSAAMIDHAHVAKVFDIGCEDGTFFYSRTWIDGMSARQLLAELASRGAAMPLEHALLITRRVADAVAAAHQTESRDGTPTPVIHGALSASRVLISRYGEVVVTGFTGEAIFDDRGGPAPDLSIDERSDVYAIGALLFELIAGVPANASGRRPVLSSIDPGVPARLDELVAKALADDPDERHPDVESLLFELRQVAGGLPRSSTAYNLGSWMTATLEDDAVTTGKPRRRDARKMPVIEPTLVRPKSEIPEPSARVARGSLAPPAPGPSPSLSYAQIPEVVRPRAATPPKKRRGTAGQLLILLAVAALLFAGSLTITMALQ